MLKAFYTMISSNVGTPSPRVGRNLPLAQGSRKTPGWSWDGRSARQTRKTPRSSTSWAPASSSLTLLKSPSCVGTNASDGIIFHWRARDPFQQWLQHLRSELVLCRETPGAVERELRADPNGNIGLCNLKPYFWIQIWRQCCLAGLQHAFRRR